MKPLTSKDNREADILRTAEALARIERAKYIKDRIGKGAEYFTQVHHRALASDLSSTAKCVLLVLMGFADRDGTNAFPSHQTIAHILGCSVRTSERAVHELEEAKWIATEHHYSRRRDVAVREVLIPDSSYEIFTAETANQGPPKMADVNKDRQKWRSRPDKNGGVPTSVDLLSGSMNRGSNIHYGSYRGAKSDLTKQVLNAWEVRS